MADKYDSTRDFILVRRKSGETVLVPPDESLMLPCTFENFETARRSASAVVDGEAQIWMFEHDHPAKLEAVGG
jgi:hypothetical protein